MWLNNAGLDGHSTFGHTVLLRDFVLDLKPKVVVFLVGANDRGRKEAGGHTASHIKGPLRFNSIEEFVKSASVYSEAVSAALNSYRYLRAKSRGLMHQSVDIRLLPHAQSVNPNLSDVLEPHINTFLPAYERRLRTLVRLAKSSQIDPVLITQPLLYGKGNDPRTGINLSTLKISHNTTGHTAWTVLELYNEVTKKVGEQEKILTIDLARELDKNSIYFYDGFHFTNVGSTEVARIIYNHLRPYLMENYISFSKSREKETKN